MQAWYFICNLTCLIGKVYYILFMSFTERARQQRNLEHSSKGGKKSGEKKRRGRGGGEREIEDEIY